MSIPKETTQTTEDCALSASVESDSVLVAQWLVGAMALFVLMTLVIGVLLVVHYANRMYDAQYQACVAAGKSAVPLSSQGWSIACVEAGSQLEWGKR